MNLPERKGMRHAHVRGRERVNHARLSRPVYLRMRWPGRRRNGEKSARVQNSTCLAAELRLTWSGQTWSGQTWSAHKSTRINSPPRPQMLGGLPSGARETRRPVREKVYGCCRNIERTKGCREGNKTHRARRCTKGRQKHSLSEALLHPVAPPERLCHVLRRLRRESQGRV